MHENIVLCAFALLPVILGFVVYRFVKRYRGKRPRSPLVLVVGNALVFLFLASVVTLSGECYYRFLYDTTDSFGLTKTTQRWFARHFQRNRQGMRDNVDYVMTRRSDKRRVTFLGDSFTAGHGVPNVEDRFANRIRARNPGLEIQTIAKCGWDTGAEMVNGTYLLDNGFDCDVVVLVYCLNDVADILPEWPAILKRIYEQPKPGYFASHSYMINSFYYRYQAAQDPDIGQYYNFTQRGYAGAQWEQQKSRLKAIRDRVDAADGQFMVVTFPFLHAIDRYGEYEDVHKRLGELWGALDVPHLDLLTIYKSLPARELVVNSRDAHPNEHAHKLAADAIETFLHQNGVK